MPATRPTGSPPAWRSPRPCRTDPGAARGGAASDVLELAVRADDPDRLRPEVDEHGSALDGDGPTDAVEVVGDPVVDLEGLDHRLGFGLEGAGREVAPLGPGSCRH